jgi:hypothetical protein
MNREICILIGAGLLMAAAPQVGQAQEALRTTAYRASAEEARTLAILRAVGLMPPSDKEGDWGRLGNAQVAEHWTVTGVPIEFVSRSTDAALLQAAALGLLPEYADEFALDRALKNRTLNRHIVSKALVAWWTTEIMATWPGPTKDKRNPTAMLQHDLDHERAITSAGAAAGGPLGAAWLLFPAGLDSSFSPQRQTRRPVSVRMLLERFDPDSAVTEGNAQVVAEELVWTYRLGLSDGRYTTLANARRVLQALLLERLGFSMGDPLDDDPKQRLAAIANLNSAMRQCQDAWKAAEGAK